MLSDKLKQLSDEQKKQLLIIGVVILVILFFGVIGFTSGSGNNNTSVKKDAYGDLIETKISGQPIESKDDTFVIRFNDFLTNNVSPLQLDALKKSIRFYIWDTINSDETKAVFDDGKFESQGESSIYTVTVRTNNNTTKFTIRMKIDNKLNIVSATADYNGVSTDLSVTPRTTNQD
ncbi:MAG: hypothetical protein U0491_00975 [Candidatus Saccharimonadales bacterium]